MEVLGGFSKVDGRIVGANDAEGGANGHENKSRDLSVYCLLVFVVCRRRVGEEM